MKRLNVGITCLVVGTGLLLFGLGPGMDRWEGALAGLRRAAPIFGFLLVGCGFYYFIRGLEDADTGKKGKKSR
ncbi:MAG TPA: hypothetical protein VNC50_03650 [Planctomycetia bacterium]|nr:hypothetical protein [Planctomycetia bacterium]